jgi:hypothetical protein
MQVELTRSMVRLPLPLGEKGPVAKQWEERFCAHKEPLPPLILRAAQNDGPLPPQRGGESKHVLAQRGGERKSALAKATSCL